jgi:hypothetical protein
VLWSEDEDKEGQEQEEEWRKGEAEVTTKWNDQRYLYKIQCVINFEINFDLLTNFLFDVLILCYVKKSLDRYTLAADTISYRYTPAADTISYRYTLAADTISCTDFPDICRSVRR